MRKLLLGLALAVLTACGSDSSPTNPTVSVPGTYDLKTINGSALPFSGVANGVTASILNSVLTLSDNGTYSEQIGVKITQGSTTTTTTLTELGTWAASGGSITFSDQTDRTTYSGSLSGSTLTEIVNGVTQVYGKR